VGKYESIVLLKKEYKTLPAFPDVTLPDTANVWMFPEKNKIIFNGKIGNIEGLFMLNLENDDQKILLDKDQLALMGKLQGVLWTQDDDKMMVKAGDNFYIIDLGDNYKTYLVSSNISKLIGTNGTVFYAQDKYVFYNQAGSIFLFNYITKENVQILGGVSSFYVYGGNIYFFKSAEAATPTLYSVNPSSPTNETKVSVMPEGYDSAQSFTVQKNGNYSLLLSATNLYVQDGDNPMEKINSNVAIAKFFQGGKRILYFNDNEIWIYYTEDKDNQPIESKGENQLLSRFSGKLSNIYLYSDEEHLFFQQDDAIDFTEMDGRDNRNTFKVMDNAEGSNIFYSRGKNMIYFLSGSKLFKIDLKEA